MFVIMLWQPPHKDSYSNVSLTLWFFVPAWNYLPYIREASQLIFVSHNFRSWKSCPSISGKGTLSRVENDVLSSSNVFSWKINLLLKT